jgi:hypothetical protein
MPTMNEEELRDFEQQLRDVLSAGSLGWVVDQVDELIAEGVYEVAAKRKGAPEVREEVKRPSDARRGASSVRPYTVHERVGLLLACARRALLDDQRLYDAVDDLLLAATDPERPRRGVLEFFDERTERTVREVRDDDDRSGRDDRTLQAVAAINGLAETLGFDDDQRP